MIQTQIHLSYSMHFKQYYSNLSRPSCIHTDAATQLKDTTTDSPSSSRDSSRQTQSHSEAANTTQSLLSTSSSSHYPSYASTPETLENEAEPARFTGSAQASSGGMRI